MTLKTVTALTVICTLLMMGFSTVSSGMSSEEMAGGSDLREEFTLKLDVVGDGYMVVDGSVVEDKVERTFPEGESVDVEARVNDGWSFDGWSGANESEEKNIELVMDGNKVLTAHFVEDSLDYHNLTTSMEGAGTVEIDYESVDDGEVKEFVDGQKVHIQAIPDEGWSFSHWNGLDHDDNNTYIEITSEKNITAVFEESYYEVIISIEGEGSVIIEGHEYSNGDMVEIEPGSEVSVEPTPSEGWRFKEWGDDATVEDGELVVDEDLMGLRLVFAEEEHQSLPGYTVFGVFLALVVVLSVKHAKNSFSQ